MARHTYLLLFDGFSLRCFILVWCRLHVSKGEGFWSKLVSYLMEPIVLVISPFKAYLVTNPLVQPCTHSKYDLLMQILNRASQVLLVH